MTSQINSTELKSFYAGLIISDGYIAKGVSNRAFILRTINKDFAEYIESFTQAHTNFTTRIKYLPAKIDNNLVHHKEHWEFSTKAHPYFAKLYHIFYDDYRKKYIHPDMLSWLDLRGLANWYMADGYCTNVGKTKGKIVNCRVEFCNDCFTYDDNLLFCKYMSGLGYKTNPIKRGNVYRASMSLYDAQRFFVEINQYIVPSMKYKLYMNIQRPWMTDEYLLLKSDILAQGLAYKSQ